uniref:CSON002115 protein n=1 Tax=Culicoides sonorensis TaxID=179676 RepID=A0A336LVC1_CULSO
MLLKFLFIANILILSIINVNGGISEIFNLKDYFRMPLMSSYDPYDPCMFSSTTNRSIYCITRTKIKPDPSNSVWNYTEAFSSKTKLHFRHDVIMRGICIESCMKKISQLSAEEIQRYDSTDFNDEDFTYDPVNFKNTLKYRRELQKSVNLCVNMQLKDQFNLTGYSTINHCDAEDDDYSYDYLDKIFILIVILIALSALSGTIYDMRFRKNRSEVEKSQVFDKVLMSFSLQENWKRLMAPPKTKLSQDLKFVQAIRCMSMFVIVYMHLDMGFNMNPANPEYIELHRKLLICSTTLDLAISTQTFVMRFDIN